MTYSISSVSNRDLQILYHYRILRRPSELLDAIYTAGESVNLKFPAEGTLSSNTLDNEIPLYEFTTEVSVVDGKIPFLEFFGEEIDWVNIQDLVSVTVEKNSITLYSTYRLLGDTTQVRLYWVSSLETIQNILSEYAVELKALQRRLNELNDQMNHLDFSGDYLERPQGVVDNLIKFIETESDSVSIGDSQHMITGPVLSQNLTNPTSEYLARMVKDISGDISIICTDGTSRVLQDLVGAGEIKISGTGTWYLTNVSNSILFERFTGSVYLNQCPDVRTGPSNVFHQMNVVNSFLVHNVGTINELTLVRHAIVKQNSGIIKQLVHVGVGCEYYSQTYSWKEPKFTWNCIQGLVCLANGLIILNGKEISFVTGHHDDPLPPTEIKTIMVTHPDSGNTGGSGTIPLAPTDTLAGQVWNWFVKAGIKNVSDRPEVIAGIIGNMIQETGGGTYNLMILGCGRGYYGPWCESTDSFRTSVESAGFSWYSYYGGTRPSNESAAIPTVLKWLTQSSTSWTGWFIKDINKPTNRTGKVGARSYAELFCVCIERCIGGSDAVEDTGVYASMTEYYNGDVYLYQELEQRRDYAERVYTEFYGGV